MTDLLTMRAAVFKGVLKKVLRSILGVSFGPFIGGPPIPSGNRVLEFIAAENLKNTILAPLFRGMGHRVTEHRVPYQTGSGNRVFGVFSCRKPQKHDSRPFCSGV